eukprot:CAMPEP_0172801934 /NCGR_PEP_ID=MMETSP1075-20121228/3552_1 /TAXON_ID=2916 /ORGANISM="Ceratium fusus, Strain PA161109" /LENGTH=390 /DNA_ID=CAMNT_0013640113 /DNA_START=83 /DNA_END=1251 /DNA_ORIENTATION=-
MSCVLTACVATALLLLLEPRVLNSEGSLSTPATFDVIKDLHVNASSITPELRRLLWCWEVCSLAPSKEDQSIAEGLLRHSKTGQAHDEEAHAKHVLKVCTSRCKRGQKQPEEVQGLPSEETLQVPQPVAAYHHSAQRCIAAGVRRPEDAEAALHGLEECGVVHLNKGLVSSELLSMVSTAAEKLARDSKNAFRMDQARLRAGRQELWPPFAWPFNSSEVLQPAPSLAYLLRKYLGDHAVMDHATILIAPASATVAQAMHSDVPQSRLHLEIHFPLVNVTPHLGPTKFCPSSHGVAQQDDLMRAYFAASNCSGDASLSYALPLQVGQATIYDSSVFHAGSANLAGIDRPVFQLSWAANMHAVKARSYAETTFSNMEPAQWSQIAADINSFR